MNRQTVQSVIGSQLGELREQLAHMTAAVQLLERTASGGRERTYLGILNHSICKAQWLMRRMDLAYLLTEEDEVRSFPQLTDLSMWFQREGEHLQGVLAGGGYTLSVHTTPGLMANVDVEQLEFLLLAMVEEGGQHSRTLSLSLEQAREGYVRLTMRTQGADVLPRGAGGVFEPNEAFSSWNIPMTLRIVQLHGGSMVEEQSRQGTYTLVATLPQRIQMPTGTLASPERVWHSGGFDHALVGLSQILPTACYGGEDLE